MQGRAEANEEKGEGMKERAEGQPDISLFAAGENKGDGECEGSILRPEEAYRNWEEGKDGISTLFKTRDPACADEMRRAILWFYQLLFWSNGQEVDLTDRQKRVEWLELKPHNVVDRLSFIEQNPRLAHSFLQLQELFAEQWKRYAKDRAMKSIKKSSE